MGANSYDIRGVILSKLVEIEQHLKEWETQCLNSDYSYHFSEIRSYVGRTRYHIDQIPKQNVDIIEETVVVPEVMEEELLVDIPADGVKAKVDQVKLNVTFRDKKIRKAPSWKYLEKWMSILDEEYKDHKKDDEDDYQGVNIIVPRRIQQFGGNNNKKCNSTECILDQVPDSTSTTKFDSSNKRFISEGNLLDNFEYKNAKRDSLGNVITNNYLLSLRDLQSFDRLNNNDDNTSSDSDDNADFDAHKPRIVGVIEKKKL